MALEFAPDPDLTDGDVLDALLSVPDRLSGTELKAFRTMLGRIEQRGGGMTPRQRQWAEDVYHRLELDVDRVLNLVSTGKVEKVPVPVYEWERNRPLKPPGRR